MIPFNTTVFAELVFLSPDRQEKKIRKMLTRSGGGFVSDPSAKAWIQQYLAGDRTRAQVHARINELREEARREAEAGRPAAQIRASAAALQTCLAQFDGTTSGLIPGKPLELKLREVMLRVSIDVIYEQSGRKKFVKLSFSRQRGRAAARQRAMIAAIMIVAINKVHPDAVPSDVFVYRVFDGERVPARVLDEEMWARMARLALIIERVDREIRTARDLAAGRATEPSRRK